MIYFWLKNEVFELSFLPFPNNCKLSLNALRNLAHLFNNADVTKQKRLNFSSWLHIAHNYLELGDSLARSVYTTFLLLDSINKGQKNITDFLGSHPVDSKEFLCYLFVLLFHGPDPAFPKPVTGDAWPGLGSVTPQSPLATARQKQNEPEDHFAFVARHIHILIDALVQLEDGGDTVIPPGESLLGGDIEGSLSLESLNCLSFLLGAGSSYVNGFRSVSEAFVGASTEGVIEAATAKEFILARLGHNHHAMPILTFTANGVPTIQEIPSVEGYGKESTAVGAEPVRRPVLVVGMLKRTAMYTEVQARDCPVRITSCVSAHIYVLSAVRSVIVSGCNNATLVLGSVAGVVMVENCTNMQIVCTCAGIRVRNTTDSQFFVCCNSRPIVLPGCRGLTFGPYNTFYPALEEHMHAAGVTPLTSFWDKPLLLSNVDADDSVAEEDPAFKLLLPSEFAPAVIPFDIQGDTKTNPVPLPEEFRDALAQRLKCIDDLRDSVASANLDSESTDKLQSFMQKEFRNWLVSSGNHRQVYELLHLSEIRDNEQTAPE